MAQRHENATQFARFCIDHEILPGDLRDMIIAAERSKAAYEGNRFLAHEGKMCEVEKIARKYAIKVTWPGLWPMLTIDGKDYSLPCL